MNEKEKRNWNVQNESMIKLTYHYTCGYPSGVVGQPRVRDLAGLGPNPPDQLPRFLHLGDDDLYEAPFDQLFASNP